MEHEDVWADILKRVPIESVCRLRSVCKCWNSLISSAFFINLHLSFNCSATPPNLKPCFRVASGNSPKFYILFHPTLDGIGVKDEDQQQQQLHFPIRTKVGFFDLVGIVHGVACFSHYSHCCSLNTTLVWNPRVHKYIVLPYLSMCGDRPYYTTGFGYDKGTNDFKVVLFWVKEGKYQVYSSRQGRWGPLLTLSRFKSWHVHKRSGTSCFVNGTIHWIISRYQPNFKNALLMFDCESQKFRRRLQIIPKALFCSPGSSIMFSRINLLVYGGCMLAALVGSSISSQRLHLWVMNNNGGGWDKVYTISEHLYQNLDDDSNNDDDSITVHNPTYEKMGPFGTRNPSNKFRKHRFYNIWSDHVYDETMFLMDHPKAHSYTDQDEIDIHSPSIST